MKQYKAQTGDIDVFAANMIGEMWVEKVFAGLKKKKKILSCNFRKTKKKIWESQEKQKLMSVT